MKENSEKIMNKRLKRHEIADLVESGSESDIKEWILSLSHIDESYEYYDEDDEREHYTYPPLISAISYGSMELVKWIIKQGADIKKMGRFEKSPLMCASNDKSNDNYYEIVKHKTLSEERMKRKMSIIKLLLEAGADPYEQDKKLLLSPYEAAKQRGERLIVTLFDSYLSKQ